MSLIVVAAVLLLGLTFMRINARRRERSARIERASERARNYIRADADDFDLD